MSGLAGLRTHNKTLRHPGTTVTRYRPLALGMLSVALTLSLWEMAANAGIIPVFFVSTPSQILRTFQVMVVDGTLARHALVSATEFWLGFALAIVVGIPIGLAMGWYLRFNAVLSPFVTFFYVTPRIALVGLIVVWFGLGIESKAVLVFLGAVFPILYGTASGLRSVDSSLIRAAKSFGATDFQFFLTVALPASVPLIVTGVRLAVGRGLIGVVVGELVGSSEGLGYLIYYGAAILQPDIVFVGLFSITVIALVSLAILGRLERALVYWRPSGDSR